MSIFTFLIALTAVLCCTWVVVSLTSARGNPANDKLEAEIEQLKSRVSTLESIVTDQGYQLDKEISRL
jgi:hypothetical protein